MAQDDVDAADSVGGQQASRAARGWAWCARRRSWFGAVAIVLGAAALWLLVPLLFEDPPPMEDRSPSAATDRATYAQAVATTRTGVLAGLAGLGALVTIRINYRNSETNAQTLATTQETFRVTERGHLTDRYTKAIEQLGDAEHLPIRLGGVYALQQLALDTPVLGDRAAVREVLAAFVRTAAADRDAAAAPIGPWPSVDVRAAATVLGRIHRQGEPRADLRGIRLAGAELAGVNLTGADLDGADLTGANLFDADFTGARLLRAYLTSANLTYAVLSGAAIYDTDVTDADLYRAAITRASWWTVEDQLKTVRRRPDGSPGTSHEEQGAPPDRT